jgi:hypothetical protein
VSFRIAELGVEEKLQTSKSNFWEKWEQSDSPSSLLEFY